MHSWQEYPYLPGDIVRVTQQPGFYQPCITDTCTLLVDMEITATPDEVSKAGELWEVTQQPGFYQPCITDTRTVLGMESAATPDEMSKA